jgi:hypothetical protein
MEAAFLSAREIYAASQQDEMDKKKQEEGLAAEEVVQQVVEQTEEEAVEKDQGHQAIGGADLAVHDAFAAASSAMVTSQNSSGAVASSGAFVNLFSPDSFTKIVTMWC